jgi:hypothetical protein
MTKEEIYDEHISPLMTQIIAICKEHNIANLCSFSLDREEGLMCTTAMLDDEFDPPESMLRCLSIIKPPTRSAMTMIVEKADGSKEHHVIV